jgi:hypothetical protein
MNVIEKLHDTVYTPCKLLVPEATVMKEPGKTYVAAILVIFVMSWILSEPQLLLAQRAGAQPYPPPRPNPGSAEPRVTLNGSDPRAPGASDSTSENGRKEWPRNTEAILLRRRAAAQLAEDFERLKQINRERMAPLSSSASVDYKALSQVVSEINTRAKRIKENTPIALKKVEKATYDEDASRLPSMIPELSRLIDSFLGSPIFHETSINDDELRSTAGRDLEGIIRLSATINKIAKRLAKASTQPA